ncbi:hypothetical protein [Microbacterium sp. SA39]|uniref:hypothetical protein n=1 Tax=Microbacterium sp. SA39 TaxID=1263625 RepID=UPI0005FA54EF|nr:hypothetical protein [Microbacterium sp. SA39]KJQ54156.1 hypothetical protein RS85_02227 [Microbacterium sp. SA39]
MIAVTPDTETPPEGAAEMVEVVLLDILRVTGRVNDHALKVLYEARADAYPGIPKVSSAAVLAARISLRDKALIGLASGSIELWELASNKKAPAPMHRDERQTPTKGITS